MPCKPNFEIKIDGNGRRRFFLDGAEEQSETEFIRKHVDRFGVEPEPPKPEPMTKETRR